MSASITESLPLVTLVTVTYNSEKDLPEFLSCVDSLDYSNLSLVVIDNNSSDSSVRILETFTSTSVEILPICNNKNLGISVANNQGIVAALEKGSEWIVLINNDVSFSADLVSKLVPSIETLVSIPVIPYYDRRDLIWFKTGNFAPSKGFTGQHINKNMPVSSSNFRDPLYSDYAPTCCMAIHRSVFPVVGMMDEDYFVYFDDTDFCYRLKKANIKIRVIQDAFLFHKVGASTGGIDSLFTIEQTSKNRVIYLRKNFGLAVTLCFLPIFVVFYVYVYAISKPSLVRLKLSIKSTINGLIMRLT